MCSHYQNAFLLPYLQDLKSLILRWRSFSRWGRQCGGFSFAYKRWQHFHYVYSLPNPVFISWLTGPKIIDAHFQDGAGSVVLPVLFIPGGNTSIMCIHYQIAFLLSDLQDLKWLTFCWHSFCHGRNRNMEPFTLVSYLNHGLVAAVLCCSGTFSFLTTLFFNDAYEYTLQNIL